MNVAGLFVLCWFAKPAGVSLLAASDKAADDEERDLLQRLSKSSEMDFDLCILWGYIDIVVGFFRLNQFT